MNSKQRRKYLREHTAEIKLVAATCRLTGRPLRSKHLMNMLANRETRAVKYAKVYAGNQLDWSWGS